MTKVVECCTLVSRWCDALAPISPRDLLESLLVPIADPNRSPRELVANVLFAYVNKASCARDVALPSSVSRAAIVACWDATTVSDASVDRAIERLSAQGVDGERLCWAVITRESCNHIPLVRREANRMAKLWPDRTGDDLVGYGWRGVRLALRSYNPDQAWFSTYACPKIKGAIRDGVRNEHHLPKRLTTFVNKVEHARDALAAAMSSAPTVAEIARCLDVDEAKVRATAYYVTPSSLDQADAVHALPTDVDVEEIATANLLADAVASAISELPDEEAEAVELLVLQQVPIRVAQERTGASPKQLRARRDRALVSLRATLESWDID